MTVCGPPVSICPSYRKICCLGYIDSLSMLALSGFLYSSLGLCTLGIRRVADVDNDSYQNVYFNVDAFDAYLYTR